LTLYECCGILILGVSEIMPSIDLPDPDPKDVESYLKLDPGAFDHIPHYAREAALDAIRHVMKLEKSHLFRPGLYYILRDYPLDIWNDIF
jgi:hypothetical protein